MPKQPAIPGLRDAMKKKLTRREQFLAEMDGVVPWGRLLALIAPHYPKAGPKGGRPPMPLETMLRVYFLQNWYALSDPMAEETLYDSEAMRRFAGIELGDDRIPDETTILNFRHLLERHGLRPPASAAMRWRIAVHESGHAIVAHELGRGQPKFMALTGGGGIMERECISDDQTRGAFDAEIATILAGRAAEKLMLGSASAGAGGTVDSDLARASATACAIELSFGLGECRAWVTTADRAILRLANDVALRQTVETQLQAAETTALDILRNRQGTLIELATALLSKGVLDHDMIRDILLRGVVETCEL